MSLMSSQSGRSSSAMAMMTADKPAMVLKVGGSAVGHGHPQLHHRPLLASSKFQVLSPISDKSQEQSSEQGTIGHRTPKVSNYIRNAILIHD